MNKYRIYSLVIQHSYGLDGPFKMIYVLRIVIFIDFPYQTVKFPGSKPNKKPTVHTKLLNKKPTVKPNKFPYPNC